MDADHLITGLLEELRDGDETVLDRLMPAVRQILVNHAHKHGTKERGGRWRRIPFDEAVMAVEEQADMVLALDEALTPVGRAQ